MAGDGDNGQMLALARACLLRWPLPESATVRLVNVSENATFRVEAPAAGLGWALRVHRPGYHALGAIRSELAWSQALRGGGIIATPAAIAGRDGGYVQTVPGPVRGEHRHVTLYDWEAGTEPLEMDLAAFAAIGAAAARLHNHARDWRPPNGFERPRWDFDTTLGATPRWGRWRDGIGITDEIAAVFERTRGHIRHRLQRFGSGPDRFGLIHGDMRPANVLLHDGKLTVLDFDDCGFSWFLYDAAAAVSFFEHKPAAASCLAAWLEGYRGVRQLTAADEAELPTFVMLRRLLLIAWLGSRRGTGLAHALGAGYTQAAVPMCQDYLRRMPV